MLKLLFEHLLVLFLLIFVLSENSFAQSKIKSHPFSGTLVLSFEGGVTLAKTDYKNDKFGLKGIGAIDYFLPTSVASIFGVRAFFGGQTVAGEDKSRVPVEFLNEMYLSGGGITYSISVNEKFFPFIYLGVSKIWFSPKDEKGNRAPNNSLSLYDRNTLSFDIELGTRIPLSAILSLKFGLSFHYVQTDYFDDIKAGAEDDFYATSNIGLAFSLFAGSDQDDDGVNDPDDICPDTPPGVIVDEFGCPVDTDKDGVADYIDVCPDTKSGIKVDAEGCPVDSDFDGVKDDIDNCPETPFGVVVDRSGCPEDSDNDGVPNYLDKCPDTIAGEDVDEDGCAKIEVIPEELKDNDNDGVVNTKDECADTPPGLPVNEKGCAQTIIPEELTSVIDTIIIVSDMVFNPPGSEIKSSAVAELNKLVRFFQRDAFVKWKITGYTDELSPDPEALSRNRANAIMEFFISKGLPSFQFRIEGKGVADPVGNNQTIEGRAQNRRIVISKIK